MDLLLLVRGPRPLFSRYVVGWMIAHRESATLARNLIEETCRRQDITPGQLSIHADRGPSMTSKTIAHLYADLGVAQSHSRPNVSNGNPFSEAQFKTLKYRADFPGRFGSAQPGRAHGGLFVDWYNREHRHGGIGLLTPDDVHYGLPDQRRAYDVIKASQPGIKGDLEYLRILHLAASTFGADVEESLTALLAAGVTLTAASTKAGCVRAAADAIPLVPALEAPRWTSPSTTRSSRRRRHDSRGR